MDLSKALHSSLCSLLGMLVASLVLDVPFNPQLESCKEEFEEELPINHQTMTSRLSV